jgi:hypothetical protein
MHEVSGGIASQRVPTRSGEMPSRGKIVVDLYNSVNSSI